MTKSDKIRSYFDKYESGEMSLIEVAVCSKTNQKYAEKILYTERLRIEVEKKDALPKEEILDAPKFWNPEDEIKTPPCVGHEF